MPSVPDLTRGISLLSCVLPLLRHYLCNLGSKHDAAVAISAPTSDCAGKPYSPLLTNRPFPVVCSHRRPSFTFSSWTTAALDHLADAAGLLVGLLREHLPHAIFEQDI